MLEGQTKRTVSVFIGSCDGKEANSKAISKPLGIWAHSEVMMVATGMALVLARSRLGCTGGLVMAESELRRCSPTHLVCSFQVASPERRCPNPEPAKLSWDGRGGRALPLTRLPGS